MDPDLPLIEAVQSGSEEALRELIARYREPVFHFAYRYLQNPTWARDAAEETFVRVFTHASHFRPRATVKAWIYTITLNLCRDNHRRFKREKRASGPASDTTDPVADFPDARRTPREEASLTEELGCLQEEIERLPHKLKSALVLFAFEKRSQKECAELLNCSAKGVELRVYRARERLRKRLSARLGR